MDMDMFLWQHVSRPCVFGRGKGVAAGKHLFFPPSSGLECFAVHCFVAGIKCAELFLQLP